MDLTVRTQFSLEDEVFVMDDDKIKKGKVVSIEIKYDDRGVSVMYELDEVGQSLYNRWYKEGKCFKSPEDLVHKVLQNYKVENALKKV